MMTLQALRLFVTIAESGGIGRASTRLHLSQPAASRQLQGLESQLGVLLFERIGRSLQLTSEGEDLLRHARHLLMGADQFTDRAHALKGGQTGTLKVAATPHVIASVLAAFLRHYCVRYPSIEVRLVEGGAAAQPARLQSGEVHLALMPFGDGTVEGQLLYPVYGLAVVSDTHPLGARRVLNVSDLRDEPVLLLQRGFGSRAWFEAASEIEHFKPRIRLESAAPETLVELAASQYGVAIVPSTVIVRGRGIRVLPLVQRGAALGRWSMVAWTPRRHLPAFAERFVEELGAHVRVNYPGRDFVKHAPPLPRPKCPKKGALELDAKRYGSDAQHGMGRVS